MPPVIVSFSINSLIELELISEINFWLLSRTPSTSLIIINLLASIFFAIEPAGSIAKKIEARRLIIMSDVEGVLDNNQKLISEINSSSIKELIENETITGGMIPKINNCLDVASNGVKGVVIIDGRKNHSILFELLSDKGSGTLIRQ